MTLRPILFCCTALAVAVLGQAAQPTPVPGMPVQATPIRATALSNDQDPVGPIKLVDVDIDSILTTLETLTGRTIIRPAALPTASYTLQLKKAIPRYEAILALETVLGLNQIGLSPLGDKFLKVVPLAQVRTEAPELIAGSTLDYPASGRVAAKIFQLEFLRVSEFMPQIQQLLSPGVGGGVVLFEKANAALITDSISNLQRIESVARQVDRPASTSLTPKFYSLKFAKATELVGKMQAVLSGPMLQAQFGTSATYTADDRTNQVILVTDQRQHRFFDELISRLDVKSDPNTRTEVLYLKHATAKDVASLLTQIIQGQNNAAQKLGAQQQLQRSPQTPAPVAPGTPPNVAALAAAAAAVKTTDATGGSTASFSSIITVIADERTNAVVVNGTVDDIRLIKELVEKVDIVLAQVRIEVVITEVTLTDNDTSGIESLGLKVDGDKLVGFSGSLPGLAVGGDISNDKASGMATITRPGVSGSFDLAGIIKIGTSPRKTNANILSQPTIVTTHNKKANIFVGEQRPTISSYLNDGFSSGSTTGSYSSGYRSTVAAKDIGINLTVTPLIGDDGSVQLDIEQEVNDILGEILIDGNPQPRIGRRTTKSFITAKSGEVIVLGGLQRISDTRNSSRLGPIPFLGDLLGSRSKEKTRTDLIFFLRPYVLRNNPADNRDALRRIEANPQKEDVKRALDPDSAANAATQTEGKQSFFRLK